MNKKNILFIWIPKTAGSSMFNIFERFGCHKLKYPSEYIKFKNQGFITFDHISVFKLLSKNYISKEFFDNAFKFAFVRNPWDRLVSLFYFRKRFMVHEFKSFTDFCIELEKMQNKHENFVSYILDNLYNSFFHRFKYFHKHFYFHRFNRRLTPIGLYNTMGLNAINPQADWITDENGKIILDFIGRFENLESDFKKLSEILGIEGNLPKLRQSKHKNYKLYYNERTKKIVEKIYKKDIELFNYKF